MKKLILTAAAAFSMQLAFAQNSAITNALLHQKNGKLDKAKEEIDKAIVHEKTANSAKAWFTKGEIYSALGDPNNPLMALQKPEVKALSAGATEQALAAYDKAIALDKPNGEYAKQAAEKKKIVEEQAYGTAINDAVKSYQDKDYKAALAGFVKAQQIRPADTTAYLYAAASAELASDFNAANENYNKLLGINYKKPSVYSRMYYIAKNELKDEAKAKKVLQDALTVHPTNKEFMLEDLNYAVASGKSGEAIAKLEKAIASDPTNSNLYNVLGSMYDQTGKKDLAQATYEKALKADPNNFDANFNLGVLHFNKGADLSRKYNKLDYASQKKVGVKMNADINNYFKASLPYFEASHKINPKDVNTMETLAKIYINLGRTKDAEAMNKKADAVKK